MRADDLGANPKKLIILGGANCQISAFERAKRVGVKTVLFDMNDKAPATTIADEFYNVSTFDTDACVKAARSTGADGVMTLGTDQPVYTAALIAKSLNLPSLILEETALAVTNKAVMKQTLSDNGIPSAKYWIADKDTLKNLKPDGPIVIKPLDSQGQRGVFRCESIDEAVSLYDETLSYSRSEKALVERYYSPSELTVSAWVHEGRATILTVTDRITYPHARHIGVCAAHRFPSVWGKGRETELTALIKRLTDAFCIRSGPLYVQLLLGHDGLIVNELACRIGGAFEDCFIPFITGFDILQAVMDGALGKHVLPPAPFDAGDKEATVLMPYARAGRLGRITPLNIIRGLDFVHSAAYNFTNGDTIPAFENSKARLAHAVILTRGADETRHAVERFYDEFYALDHDGNDMLLPIPWEGGEVL